jgi:2,3-bisphosphoglycerate-independent phosphoglycerate mutase
MFDSAEDAIKTYRKESLDKGIKLIDQDMPPFVVDNGNGQPVAPIKDDDIVILFNFRGDRALEISRAFTEADDTFPFARIPSVKVHFAGLMEYDGDLKIPKTFLVEPPAIDRTVSEYLVKNGVNLYAIAETQKFGHITYFWNGNNSEKFNKNLETWKEVPSDKVPFEKAPRMKADQVTKEIVKALKSKKYKFLRVNLANGDMVGHTGNLRAAIEAVECLDENLKILYDTAQQVGATMVISADHGNCDQMFEIDKELLTIKNSVGGSQMVKTSHTLSPVPFIVTGNQADEFELNEAVESPGLGNIAASILTILGYQPPDDYLPSLVVHK